MTNKTKNLTSMDNNILTDMEQRPTNSTSILKSYGHVLIGRDIQYSLFDENSAIIYSTGLKTPLIELRDEEWQDIKNGKPSL